MGSDRRSSFRRAACLATLFASGACAKSPATPTGSAPGANAAPIVTVAFDGPSACTPQPRTPCTLSVFAEARDPDGDPLRYTWSGCAAGTAPRATCTIDRPGRVLASVEVSDDHGHAISSAGAAEGLNHAPGIQIGYISPSRSGTSIGLLGNVQDADEGFLCGRQYCVSATATGACGSATVECTCLAGLEAYVTRTAASGTCTVTFTLRDSWDQIGTPSVNFDVSNPGEFQIAQ